MRSGDRTNHPGFRCARIGLSRAPVQISTQLTQQKQIMEIKTNRLIIVILVAAGSAMLGLAGCAGVGSSNTESLLSAAVFRAGAPQTPQQRQIYAPLPVYRVHRATVNGSNCYA